MVYVDLPRSASRIAQAMIVMTSVKRESCFGLGVWVVRGRDCVQVCFCVGRLACPRGVHTTWTMHTRRSPGRSSSKARPTLRKPIASPTTKRPARRKSKGASHNRKHPSPSKHSETPNMDPGKPGKETADAVEVKEERPVEVKEERPDLLGYSDLGLIAVFVISCITFGLMMKSDSSNQLLYVWAYSWITAVCTGIGAIPFLLVDDVNKYWLGVCNAAAAGMMIAASIVLLYEGLMSTSDSQCRTYGCFYCVSMVEISIVQYVLCIAIKCIGFNTSSRSIYQTSLSCAACDSRRQRLFHL